MLRKSLVETMAFFSVARASKTRLISVDSDIITSEGREVRRDPLDRSSKQFLLFCFFFFSFSFCFLFFFFSVAKMKFKLLQIKFLKYRSKKIFLK